MTLPAPLRWEAPAAESTRRDRHAENTSDRQFHRRQHACRRHPPQIRIQQALDHLIGCQQIGRGRTGWFRHHINEPQSYAGLGAL